MKLTLSQNSFWSLVDVVSASGLGFIVSIIIARYLGPELFGQYSFYVVITALICGCVTSGIMIITIREAVKKNWRFKHYIEQTISIFLIYSLPVIIIITLLVNIIFINDVNFYFAALFQISMVFFGFSIHFFMNLQRFDIATLLNFLFRTVFIGTALLTIVLFSNSISIKTFFLINFIILTLLFFYSIYLYQKNYNVKIKLKINWKLQKKYIFLSLPVAVAALSEFLNLKIDTIMLGFLSSNYELGLYSASYTIYLGLLMVPLSLTKVFNPIFIERTVNDLKSASNFFYKFLFIYLLYSFFVITIMKYSTNFLINLTYGSEYLEASNILFYLLLALPFISINRLINYSMIALGKQKIYMYYTLVGTIINFLINLHLIPIYGAYGAVIATIITEFFIFIIGGIYVIYFFHSKKS